jgi:hypothetical protein
MLVAICGSREFGKEDTARFYHVMKFCVGKWWRNGVVVVIIVLKVERMCPLGKIRRRKDSRTG